ncbi:hypothetical protein LS73_005265 [Helicobacter muridarum]|uniref:Uncharacterized protein n=1 Tax=Helicobacter muridarum TaxID=216 RepID=A0A099U001_9HELI|nr:hypothetical protein [Helicobacter muridarum]TLE00214.1 hypothetical protein LS73_005265 [Helicobacter muridarum]STQ85701.1 Uncharacterised protein [Helicobacter muridarum]
MTYTSMLIFIIYAFNNFKCNGFNIFGFKVFDLSAPFSYFEAFSTIILVLGLSLCIFLYLFNKGKSYKKK